MNTDYFLYPSSVDLWGFSRPTDACFWTIADFSYSNFRDCSIAPLVMFSSLYLDIFVYYLMCYCFQWLGRCSCELWCGEMKSLAVDDKDKKRSRNWPQIVIGDQNSFSVFNFRWTYLRLILNKVKPGDKVLIDMLVALKWFQCFHSKSNAICELFQIVCFQTAYIIKLKYYLLENTSPRRCLMPGAATSCSPTSFLPCWGSEKSPAVPRGAPTAPSAPVHGDLPAYTARWLFFFSFLKFNLRLCFI